jgi:predicted transcriptional regulator
MDHRRSETAILAEILRYALEKPGITKVMYCANLNHRAAGKYLNELQEKGLIEIVDQSPRKKFQTTPRGKVVLGRLEEALQLIERREHDV